MTTTQGMRSHGWLLGLLAAIALMPAGARAQATTRTPASASAGSDPTTPRVITVCVTRWGIVYQIKEPGLRNRCARRSHREVSWTVGLPGHDHGALNGLEDDDHPQYMLGGEAAAGDLGGSYPNPTVVGLQGNAVSTAAPTGGQVLTWSDAGSTWQAHTPTTGVTDHGALTGLTDNDHPQYLLTDGVRSATDGFAVTGTPGSGSIPASGAGVRLMWYPGKAAFRVGFVTSNVWDDANIGRGSVAMGTNPTASGPVSIAMGSHTTASGIVSTAMGEFTTASGHTSTAMGSNTTASGRESIAMGGGTRASGRASMAMGLNTTASGRASIAMGDETVASGEQSTAMGTRASTNGHGGAFVYGDGSTSATVTAPAANSFTVRAAGGTTFYSNSALTAGVSLAAGAGAWATVSDRNRKHQFRDADGESVLERIARMPIQGWAYKAQDPTIRHLGPTAQDFHAAFGLGGSDTTITTSDISGVNMLAIQALEARTREVTELEERIAALETERAVMRQRLSALEAVMTRAGRNDR